MDSKFLYISMNRLQMESSFKTKTSAHCKKNSSILDLEKL